MLYQRFTLIPTTTVTEKDEVKDSLPSNVAVNPVATVIGKPNKQKLPKIPINKAKSDTVLAGEFIFTP